MNLWKLVLLALACCAPASAQVATGEISGYVLDPSRRAIAGAEVRAGGARGVQRRTLTDSMGFYRLAALPPAFYTLTVSAVQFEAARREAVQVQVDSTSPADFVLAVEGLRQSIEVPAGADSGEASLSAGIVFDEQRIARLPLNRRDFLQLALLTPGVAPPTEGSELSSRGSVAMHAAGAREEYNNFLLDGADNNDAYTNRYLLQPPVDSIQEFKIAAGPYSAEYGRNAGAQVNVVTRAGGARLHGSAYHYLRNRVLDARNFFDGDEKPPFIRNQAGGGAGGPVVPNRVFFFAAYDALRERRGLSRLATVPTLAERSGDLSALGRPVVDPFTRQPFQGNRIPDARIHPLARRVLDLFPLPDRPGDSANFLAQPIQRERQDLALARLDARVSGSDTLMLRYGYGLQDLHEPFAEESTDIPGFGDVVDNTAHNVALTHQRVLGTRAVNTATLAFSHSFRQALPENHAVDAGREWGVIWLGVRPRDFGFPALQVAGYSQAGDVVQLPLERKTNTIQFTEAVSLVRGRHGLRIGGEVRHVRFRGLLDYFARGQLAFSGALSGSGISDLLLGLPSFGIQSEFDNPQNLRTTAVALYAQDDWRPARNWTVSLGLRYEYASPPVDPRDRMTVFDTATGSLVQVGTAGVSRSGLSPDRNNFAPRLGLAWTPAPGWVMRGGYGVFYEAGMLVVNSSLYFNPPYFNVRLFVPTAQGLLTLDNPFPRERGLLPPPSPNTLSPDLATSYLQHWNLAVERLIGSGAVVRLAYVGSKGTRLLRSRDLNQALPGPGLVALRRPNPAFGGIFFTESGANSSFHALEAGIDRRLARGFSLLAHYTWSKSIDDTSAFLGTKADKNFPQDSRNYRAERAVSSFDVRHRLAAAWIYAPPINAWWARNTEFQGIATVQSGQPFTPILRFDNSNTGNTGGIFGSDRPNVVGDPALDDRGPERWFNTAALAVPARYTFGSAGRNVLRGPGAASLDLAVARHFAAGEDRTITLLVQSFNVLNRVNFALPERFADEPSTFGKIFSAKSPRQFQLALRFRF